MDDVELLVQIFYEFSDRHKLEQRLQEEEGTESGLPKEGNTAKNGKKQQVEERKEVMGDEFSSKQDLDIDDDETLFLDMEEVIRILEEFYRRRDERIKNVDTLVNPRTKKRSNFESEEQKKERIKREERIFWEKMTTVLNDQKLSVWRALDGALSKYYGLLVER